MTDDNDLGNAVVIERTFDAPPELIWRMWTDPERFAGWYGPPGASIPVANMDVRVGGTRLVCMVMETPNGTMRMWFTGAYREVVTNKRLVYTDSMSDEHGNVVSPSEMGMPDGHPDNHRSHRRARRDRRAHEDGHDSRRDPDRFPRGDWLDDGVRKTRRLSRRTQRLSHHCDGIDACSALIAVDISQHARESRLCALTRPQLVVRSSLDSDQRLRCSLRR